MVGSIETKSLPKDVQKAYPAVVAPEHGQEVSFIGVCVETLHLPEGGVIMVLLCLTLAVLT